MKLTNGTVSFSRVAKIDDYGVNKKAEVSLSFELDGSEDKEEALNAVSSVAQRQVEKMLGVGGKPTVAKPATAPEPVASKPEPTVEPAPPPTHAPPEPTAEITDKDLHAAATRKNEAIKNPVAIRKLVAEYNPDATKPFAMHQITQAQRQEFLNKLNKLAPVAG